MTRAKGFSYNTAICCQSLSGFLKQAGNPDQNYRPNKCHNDGTYHAASRPDSQQPKDPAAHNAAEDSENDVHQYAVACCNPALSTRCFLPRLLGDFLVCDFLGIELGRKAEIVLVNIKSTNDRFAIFGNGARYLVTHDRVRICMLGRDQRRVFDRREHLGSNHVRRPPLRLAEKLDRFLRVNLVNQFATHVLMRKSHCVASLMSYHTMELRFGSPHGERI